MKRAVGEISKAGDLRLREALEAIKAHGDARDGCTPRDEVEHMQLLADELYGAVVEYRLMLSGKLRPPVRRRSSFLKRGVVAVTEYEEKQQTGELCSGSPEQIEHLRLLSESQHKIILEYKLRLTEHSLIGR